MCGAIVTGGASGRVEACVHQLVREEVKVFIFDIAEERGQKIPADTGDAAIFCNTKLTDDTSVQNAVDRRVQAIGAIHVAVNCAGVGAPAKLPGRDAPISMKQFNGVVQINLMGTVNVIGLSAEKMLRNVPNDDGEKGIIINAVSAAAFEGQIQAAYSAPKAAVGGMTFPVAREFADYGIRTGQSLDNGPKIGAKQYGRYDLNLAIRWMVVGVVIAHGHALDQRCFG